MSMEGSTLLITDFGSDRLACAAVCCMDRPARILPLFAAGMEVVVTTCGLLVKKKSVLSSDDNSTDSMVSWVISSLF